MSAGTKKTATGGENVTFPLFFPSFLHFSFSWLSLPPTRGLTHTHTQQYRFVSQRLED